MEAIISIVLCALAFVILIILLKIINKYIFKDKIKLNFLEVFIAWTVVYIINIILVNTNSLTAMGIPIKPFYDAGATKYYFSLGYVIHVQKPMIDEDTSIEKITEFVSPFDWIK